MIIPPTSALDARRIKSGARTTELALVFGHRPSEDLLCPRSQNFACEAENFACEMFSFRMSSAKPLKTFWLSRQEILDPAVSNVIKALRPDFVSRSFLGDVFWSLGRRSVKVFLYRTFLVTMDLAFWKTNFRSCHRMTRVHGITTSSALPPPLVMPSPGLTRTEQAFEDPSNALAVPNLVCYMAIRDFVESRRSEVTEPRDRAMRNQDI